MYVINVKSDIEVARRVLNDEGMDNELDFLIDGCIAFIPSPPLPRPLPGLIYQHPLGQVTCIQPPTPGQRFQHTLGHVFCMLRVLVRVSAGCRLEYSGGSRGGGVSVAARLNYIPKCD